MPDDRPARSLDTGTPELLTRDHHSIPGVVFGVAHIWAVLAALKGIR